MLVRAAEVWKPLSWSQESSAPGSAADSVVARSGPRSTVPSTSTPAPPGPPAEAPSPPPPPKSSGGPNRCQRSSVRGAVDVGEVGEDLLVAELDVGGGRRGHEQARVDGLRTGAQPEQDRLQLAVPDDHGPLGADGGVTARLVDDATAGARLGGGGRRDEGCRDQQQPQQPPHRSSRASRVSQQVDRRPGGQQGLAQPRRGRPSAVALRARTTRWMRIGRPDESSGSSTSARTPHGRPRSAASHRDRSRGR